MNGVLHPKFTGPALKRWEAIPVESQKRLLSSVPCVTCRHETTITNFTGVVRAGSLLLVGKCAECHNDVAKQIPFA